MPKDNIERAIARATGGAEGSDAYEAIVYEGYGPDGVAIIVEALTDNRNRTAADVRAVFSKHHASLGAPGSVAWQFDRKGVIQVPAEGTTEDDVVLAAADAGAEDAALDGERLAGHDRADRAGGGPRRARGERSRRSSRPSCGWSRAARSASTRTARASCCGSSTAWRIWTTSRTSTPTSTSPTRCSRRSPGEAGQPRPTVRL